jgi:Zn-dependent protease with chaperone function
MAFPFEQVAQRLEATALQSPRTYRLKVAAFAVFGYVAYAGILLLILLLLAAAISVAAHAGFIGLSLLVGGLVALASFLRALWVRLPQPEGRPVTPQEAPRLFAELRDLQHRLRGPKIHAVKITSEHNASLTQVPRLGIFGWQQNFLTLGYELMVTLSPEEFRAVVAHEIGHASGNHGRFGAWVYRVRMSWRAVLTEMKEQAKYRQNVWVKFVEEMTSSIAETFFNWYVPRLDAYSFVLRRIHEYEADAAAADIVGNETASRALLALHARDSGRYWTSVWRKTADLPHPPENPYAGLGAWLADAASVSRATAVVSIQLKLDSSYRDVHPCLRERLKALGCDISQPPSELVRQFGLDQPLKTSAAETYLNAAEMSRVAGQLWNENVRGQWAEQHKMFQQSREGLAQLDKRAQQSALSVNELIAQASYAANIGDTREKDLWETALAKDPSQVAARFHVGRLRLAAGDPTGEQLLHEVAQQLEWAEPAYAVLIGYFQSKSDADKAKHYVNQLQVHRQRLVNANAERERISIADEFRPHGLAPQTLSEIRKLAQEYPRLGRMLIAQKKLRFFPEHMLFVIALVPHRKWYRPFSIDNERSDLIPMGKWIKLPGQGKVFVANGGFSWVKQCLEKVEGSEIYRRLE